MNTGRKEDARNIKGAGRRISNFAQGLLAEWKHKALPLTDERLIVAVSGGADSTALLLGLDELLKAGRLSVRVIVAHLDHGLRGAEGEEDAQWVAKLARELGYEMALERACVKERAIDVGDNLEQAARRARYEFLSRVADEREAHMVLTAHTMDDQAETVLMRLMRGSSAEGLSGIETVRTLSANRRVLLIRPLLDWARRAETEGYCRERGVAFRVDEMNLDEKFARVRVRRQLLPLMQTFNPKIVEALVRTATLLREDASVLASIAGKVLQEAGEDARVKGATRESEMSDLLPPLRVNALKSQPAAVRRRALRQWIARGRGDLRRLELVHLLAVEELLKGERGGRRALLPGGAFVERRRGKLWLHVKKVEKENSAV